MRQSSKCSRRARPSAPPPAAVAPPPQAHPPAAVRESSEAVNEPPKPRAVPQPSPNRLTKSKIWKFSTVMPMPVPTEAPATRHKRREEKAKRPTSPQQTREAPATTPGQTTRQLRRTTREQNNGPEDQPVRVPPWHHDRLEEPLVLRARV